MSRGVADSLRASQDAILRRVLQLASEADFARHASTSGHEWHTAAAAALQALTDWLDATDGRDGVQQQAMHSVSEQARLHRERGVPIEMFVGLIKLVRLAAIEACWACPPARCDHQRAVASVLRFFDGLESAACRAWVSMSETDRMAELETANRRMTHERARYWTVFQSMAEPAYVVDSDMNIVAVNAALEKFYGVAASELLSRRCRDVLSHSLCDSCPLRKAMQERRPFSGVEQQVPVGGELRTVLMSGNFFDDVSGTHAGGVVLLQDITSRKHAELALAASEEKYRTIFDTAAAVIVTVDAQARVLDCNARMGSVLGYAPSEIIGRSLAMLLPPESWPRAQADLDTLVEARTVRDQDYRVLRKDGSGIDVRVDSSSIRDREGKFEKAIILIDDITRQRQLEAQLLQSQKMEAVGRLAGGVAHDFNNLLTVIIGSCAFLERKMAADDARRGDVEQIARAAARAAALTRQLLAFSRRQVLRSEIVNLNCIISELDSIVRRLIGEDIEVVLDLQPDLGTVRADHTQLEQVLMNLAVNARDAMAGGGRLTIRTSNVIVDEHGGEPGLKAGRYVLLQVSDTGQGMDEETRVRMFEPFFTTKTGGTGLGLSTAYGVIRQSGGNISCESAPRQGATFSIWLPISDHAPASSQHPASAALSAEGSELILLVEDDPAVRALASEALRASGYAVIDASNGQEAIELAGGQSRRIALLVTDVVMPLMSGRELAERIRDQRPGTRVLFMSGYSADVFSSTGAPAGSQLLLKPFTPEQLSAKVREVLDGH